MNPELDLQYLEDRGFTDLGGDAFTLDQGLRPHLIGLTLDLAEDFEAGYRSIPKGEREVLAELSRAHPTSTKPRKRVAPPPEDLTILDLYARAAAAAPALWDIMVGGARAAELPVSAIDLSDGGGASPAKKEKESEKETQCEAAVWSAGRRQI